MPTRSPSPAVLRTIDLSREAGEVIMTRSPPSPGLRYVYPDAVALDGIDAAIQPGIITGLVGPDGAGKTTLLRLIAGLLLPPAVR